MTIVYRLLIRAVIIALSELGDALEDGRVTAEEAHGILTAIMAGILGAPGE